MVTSQTNDLPFEPRADDVARRIPRLELVLAAGAAVGAFFATSAGIPFGLEDVRLPATLFAASVALPLGVLARDCAKPLLLLQSLDVGLRWHHVRWYALAVACGAAGALVGGTAGHFLNAGKPLWRQSVGDSAGIGFLCGLGLVPGFIWVALKAREAGRARLGSMVATADRRTLWGTLSAVLLLESLAALPWWGGSSSAYARHIIVWPVAGVALLLALLLSVLTWADLRALSRARRIGLEQPTLEPLEEEPLSGERAKAASDLGIGDDVYGRTEAGQTYRQGRRLVPVVQGSPELAFRALRSSTFAGIGRLVGGWVVAIQHLVAAMRSG